METDENCFAFIILLFRWIIVKELCIVIINPIDCWIMDVVIASPHVKLFCGFREVASNNGLVIKDGERCFL